MIRAAVAQGWGSAVAEVCGKPFPDCKRCRRPESKYLRESWGCDEESDRVVWESSCSRCAGSDPDCELCQGRGEVGHRRCPSAMVRAAPMGLQIQLDLLMRAYSHYDRRNVLPANGAWLDQSRSFLAGVDMIDAERGFWDNIRNEYQQNEIERSKRTSQRPRQR